MVSTILAGISSALVPRLILLANHVIASEPVAVNKLKPHAGRRIDLHLRPPAINVPLMAGLAQALPRQVQLRITPAGLLELDETPSGVAAGTEPAGLLVVVDLPEPLGAVRMALRRERPPVSIEGDAALAEAVSWLMKNLRWDLEDDLARWLGEPPTQMLKRLATTVQQAFSRLRPRGPDAADGPPRH